MSHPMHVTYQQLLGMAKEALDRCGMLHEPAHPEDMVHALRSAMEAVALGFSEGYRRGRLADDRKKQ